MKLKIILRINLLILLICSCFVSCGDNKADLLLKNEIQYNDFFKQKDAYIIYLYSSSCDACVNVNPNVIHFLRKDKDKMYTLDVYNIQIDIKDESLDVYKNKVLGTSDINNLYFISLPSLYFISDGKVENVIININDINNILLN